MRLGLVLVVLMAAAGACFSPEYEDGTTPCGSGGQCPSGLLCGADLKCYHAGTVPESCDAGFERSPVGACVDIDECMRGTDTCDGNASCTNTEGSYTCACKAGFGGDGRTCADVNECSAGTAVCDAHASCGNTVGSYTCMCDDGYTGDGKTCAESFAQIATAGDHSCARRADGALFCWGANGSGQLGAGQSVDETHAPVRIGGDRWASVATGYQYSCGLKMDGTLWCWGDGACAVLGDGGDNLFCDGMRAVYAPFPTGGSTKWKAVATSDQHACGIQMDGSLWCWGENFDGELGTSDEDPRVVPTRVGSETTWTAIAVGYRHTCGIRAGQLWCWGANDYGQLGDNAAESGITFPKRIGTAASFTSVAAGDYHTCAVLADHSMACWGDGSRGALGLGDDVLMTGAPTPTPVAGTTQWADVVAGGQNTCARSTSGSLYCFGANVYGQVGDGSFVMRTSPTAVAGGKTWSSVTLGFDQTCATTQGGQSLCWGKNSSGSIGAGTGGEVDAPADVAGAAFTQLSAGSTHQCGIKADKTLWCWGSNGYGQLGIGVDAGFRDTPVQVMGGGSWSAVSAGNHETCAIQTDGTLSCWGSSFYGELGLDELGTSTHHNAPAAVAGGGTWTRVATRQYHTCGIKADTTLWCWGLNSTGQLGVGAAGSPVDVPQQALGTGYTAISVGSSHTCAVRGGAVVCFGSNSFGQLGTGQTPPSNPSLPTPTIIDPNRDWSSVAVGQYHSCGIRGAQQTLFCWGYNYDGEIGNGSSGSSANAYAPAYVDYGTSWLTVTAGDYTTCGVAMDSKLRCWGSNVGGLVGNGNAGAVVVTPVTIDPTKADYVSVGLMSQAACALHGDGGYACWGESPNGEFGDDTTFYDKPTAVQAPE